MFTLQKFPHFHQTLSHTLLTIHPDQKILLMYFFPNWQQVQTIQGLPWWLSGEESACQEGYVGSIPGVGRTLGKGNGNPLTPVFLPEKSHGQRSLVGYSPWGHKTVRHNTATKQQQPNPLKGTILHSFIHSFIQKAFTECLLCTSARHQTGQARLLPSIGSEHSDGIKEMQAGETGRKAPLPFCCWMAFQYLPGSVMPITNCRGFYKQPLPLDSGKKENL